MGSALPNALEHCCARLALLCLLRTCTNTCRHGLASKIPRYLVSLCCGTSVDVLRTPYGEVLKTPICAHKNGRPGEFADPLLPIPNAGADCFAQASSTWQQNMRRNDASRFLCSFFLPETHYRVNATRCAPLMLLVPSNRLPIHLISIIYMPCACRFFSEELTRENHVRENKAHVPRLACRLWKSVSSFRRPFRNGPRDLVLVCAGYVPPLQHARNQRAKTFPQNAAPRNPFGAAKAMLRAISPALMNVDCPETTSLHQALHQSSV